MRKVFTSDYGNGLQKVRTRTGDKSVSKEFKLERTKSREAPSSTLPIPLPTIHVSFFPSHRSLNLT